MEIPSLPNFKAPPRWGIFRELTGLLELPKNVFGWGKPLVDGKSNPILLVPGYKAGNFSMEVIKKFLIHNNFNAIHWSEDYNNGHVEVMLEKLKSDILLYQDKFHSKIHLVGWSLGGYLSREAARELPDSVQSVITLATPIHGGPKYTIAAKEYIKNGFDIDQIEATVTERNLNPIPVPITSIYTKNDSIIDWKSSIDPHLSEEDHFEVSTTHLGVIWSPDVFHIVSNRLKKNLI